jgi:hypothetical protein
MAGDREVHDPTAVMAKDYEHKQQAKCGRWSDEEISGNEIPDVIRQERTPRLGRWAAVAQHVLGYGCLRDLDAEFAQLAVNSRHTPARVGGTHASNPFPHLCRDG